MPVREIVTCYLCGKEAAPRQMSPMGSPALGHRVDFAISVHWLCPDPCFGKARHSSLISGRIFNDLRRKRADNREIVTDALKRAEPTTDLPSGLHVTEYDLER